LHSLRTGTQPLVLCSRFGELAHLEHAPRSWRTTSRTPHRPLLDRKIPDEPRMRTLLEQPSRFSSSWSQAITRHLTDSTSNDRQFPEGGRWRVTLAAVGEICTPSLA
jgi:hypothetical protein